MCFAFEVPCHYHHRQPMSREVKSHVISAARLLIEHGRHSTHHALMSRERPQMISHRAHSMQLEAPSRQAELKVIGIRICALSFISWRSDAARATHEASRHMKPQHR